MQQSRQRIDCHPVLARRVVDFGEPPVQQLQSLGIRIQPLTVILELTLRFVQIDGRLVQQGAHPGDRAVEGLDARKRAQRQRQLRADRVSLIVIKRNQRLLNSALKLANVSQAGVLFADLCQRLRGHFQRFELRQLKAQIVKAGSGILARFHFGLNLAAKPRVGAVSAGYGFHQLGMAGVLVQHPQLLVAAQKRVVRMLAVNIDQQLAEKLQRADGDGDAIDEGARATIRAHDPAQYALTFRVFNLQRLQCLFQRGGSPGLEHRADLGPLAPGAHRLAAAAAARHQRQRVDQNGFARARLAGERGGSGAELQIDVVDDSEISNGKLNQHRCPRSDWSIGSVFTEHGNLCGHEPLGLSPRAAPIRTSRGRTRRAPDARVLRAIRFLSPSAAWF